MPLETMAALRLSHDRYGPAMDGVQEALRVHLDDRPDTGRVAPSAATDSLDVLCGRRARATQIVW
jgi:hypothetical protein